MKEITIKSIASAATLEEATPKKPKSTKPKTEIDKLKDILQQRKEIIYLVNNREEIATTPLTSVALINEINYQLDKEFTDDNEIDEYIKAFNDKHLQYLWIAYLNDWKILTQDIRTMSPQIIETNIYIKPELKIDQEALDKIMKDFKKYF